MTAIALIPAPRTPDPAERWQIVTRAQQGDPEAFGDLYRLYRDVVFRTIYRRTTNQHLAEDLTQDVFVRAIRSIGAVSWQGRDPGAWLTTIARNIAIDHLKSARVRMERAVDPELTPEAVDDDRRGDPAQVAAHNHTSTVLDAALAQLTAAEREVLALRFGAGLSVAETAVALGKNEGAVKASQHRACQKLARLLGEEASC